MEETIKKTAGFPLSILFAMIVTLALFVTLPLLTQLKITPHSKPVTQPVMIPTTKPSPPLSVEPEETNMRTPVEKEIIRREPRTQYVPQVLDLPAGGTAVVDGVVAIDIAPQFEEIEKIAIPAFTAGEVDQPPGLLRSFPPQYPYVARRDNVEGWVLLKFVVDTEGLAKDVSVVDARPVGIFEDAALKAVTRYKFKPAVKDGESVSCIIKQRIRFELD